MTDVFSGIVMTKCQKADEKELKGYLKVRTNGARGEILVKPNLIGGRRSGKVECLTITR